MRWRTVWEFFWARIRRYRRIPIQRVAEVETISCPLIQGFLRPAEDCQACEYNLGTVSRRGRSVRRCAYGVPTPPPLPAWIERLRLWLQHLPRPRPSVSPRFQWRRRSSRKLSKIEQRRLERRRRFEQDRAARHRAWLLREKALRRARPSR